YEGSHDHDVPLIDILPILQKGEVGGLYLPFANPRHAHEYKVLRGMPLGADQVLVAGVIDTVTNYIEHPEVIADRLERIVEVVGDPARVMAGTDCGFDTSAGMGRVAEGVGGSKIGAMGQGSRIASHRLFGSHACKLTKRYCAGSARRRSASAVAASAGKSDSRASSERVMSSGVPNTVVVLMKERVPCCVVSRRGTTTPTCPWPVSGLLACGLPGSG